jgi:hypothetical protein
MHAHAESEHMLSCTTHDGAPSETTSTHEDHENGGR